MRHPGEGNLDVTIGRTVVAQHALAASAPADCPLNPGTTRRPVRVRHLVTTVHHRLETTVNGAVIRSPVEESAVSPSWFVLLRRTVTRRPSASPASATSAHRRAATSDESHAPAGPRLPEGWLGGGRSQVVGHGAAAGGTWQARPPGRRR